MSRQTRGRGGDSRSGISGLTDLSGYSTVGETHDFWEIVIVLDGEIGVTAGSKVINLKSGEAILHEPRRC